jgi:hypothetical protein
MEIDSAITNIDSQVADRWRSDVNSRLEGSILIPRNRSQVLPHKPQGRIGDILTFQHAVEPDGEGLLP